MNDNNPLVHLDDPTPWQSLVERYTMDMEDEAHFLNWLRSKDISEEEARHRLTAAELDAAYDVYDRLTAPAGLLTPAHLAMLYQMADEADRVWHKSFLPTDAEGLRTQLTKAMERIAGQLKEILEAVSGENPWIDAACTHCRWPQPPRKGGTRGSRTGH
jgi:hypothetical protein